MWWLLLTSVLAADRHEADAAYRDGRFGVAARQLEDLVVATPDDADLLDRLGAARYRAGDFDGAARAWDRAATLSDEADLLFNSGSAHHQAGRLADADARYRSALEREPAHPGASRNLEILQRELEERRKPKPPKAPEDGESDNPRPSDSEDGSNAGEDKQPGDESEGSGAGESAESSRVTPADPDSQAQRGPSEGDPGQVLAAEPITEGQAHVLLDGVEEGTPRVRVLGGTGGKPW